MMSRLRFSKRNPACTWWSWSLSQKWRCYLLTDWWLWFICIKRGNLLERRSLTCKVIYWVVRISIELRFWWIFVTWYRRRFSIDILFCNWLCWLIVAIQTDSTSINERKDRFGWMFAWGVGDSTWTIEWWDGPRFCVSCHNTG